MRKSPQKKNRTLVGHISHFSSSKPGIIVLALLFGLVGTYLLTGAKALLPPASPLTYGAEGFVTFMPGHDGNYNPGDTLSAWVTASSNSYPGGDPNGQLRLIFFSDSNYVDYLGYTCDPNITCYQSGWDNPTANYNGRKDLKLCISMPVPHAVAGQQLPHILTLHYKVKQPGTSAFWINLADGSGSGSCQSNPFASGVYYNGGGAACFNNRFPGCTGTDIGFTNATAPNFSDTTGTMGPDLNPNLGTAQTPSTNPNSGGGGGSSATTQTNELNPTPSSSDQGTETKKPDPEPSPFFDGKLFATGSDPYDSANTISLGGFKLGYGWFYVAGAIIVLGVGGFFAWRWWQRRKGK